MDSNKAKGDKASGSGLGKGYKRLYELDDATLPSSDEESNNITKINCSIDSQINVVGLESSLRLREDNAYFEIKTPPKIGAYYIDIQIFKFADFKKLDAKTMWRANNKRIRFVSDNPPQPDVCRILNITKRLRKEIETAPDKIVVVPKKMQVCKYF